MVGTYCSTPVWQACVGSNDEDNTVPVLLNQAEMIFCRLS